MKYFILFCVILIAIKTTECHPKISERGCIYILGRCSEECEEGTHSFTTGCGYLTPEATCENPEPKQDTRGMICDFSACYCDPPTVRDTKTNKCVAIENCS